jgi:hypothetical protein
VENQLEDCLVVHRLLEHHQVDSLVEEEHQLVEVVYLVVEHLKQHLHQVVFLDLRLLSQHQLQVECLAQLLQNLLRQQRDSEVVLHQLQHQEVYLDLRLLSQHQLQVECLEELEPQLIMLLQLQAECLVEELQSIMQHLLPQEDYLDQQLLSLLQHQQQVACLAQLLQNQLHQLGECLVMALQPQIQQLPKLEVFLELHQMTKNQVPHWHQNQLPVECLEQVLQLRLLQ